MAAGFSMAFISICYVSEKAPKQSDFGKSNGVNVQGRGEDSKKGKAPFMSHEEGSQD